MVPSLFDHDLVTKLLATLSRGYYCSIVIRFVGDRYREEIESWEILDAAFFCFSSWSSKIFPAHPGPLFKSWAHEPSRWAAAYPSVVISAINYHDNDVRLIYLNCLIEKSVQEWCCCVFWILRWKSLDSCVPFYFHSTHSLPTTTSFNTPAVSSNPIVNSLTRNRKAQPKVTSKNIGRFCRSNHPKDSELEQAPASPPAQ